MGRGVKKELRCIPILPFLNYLTEMTKDLFEGHGRN